MILLNLFLAILLKNFEEVQTKDEVVVEESKALNLTN